MILKNRLCWGVSQKDSQNPDSQRNDSYEQFCFKESVKKIHKNLIRKKKKKKKKKKLYS